MRVFGLRNYERNAFCGGRLLNGMVWGSQISAEWPSTRKEDRPSWDDAGLGYSALNISFIKIVKRSYLPATAF